MIESWTVKEEDVNSLISRKYTVLNGKFVFSLHDFNLRDIIQECSPGIKQDLPILAFWCNMATDVLSVFCKLHSSIPFVDW